MARFVASLQDMYQDQLSLYYILSLSQAVNLDFKVESNLAKNKGLYPRKYQPEFNTDKFKTSANFTNSKSAIENPSSSFKLIKQFSSMSKKTNPYAKPMSGRCYRCNQPGSYI